MRKVLIFLMGAKSENRGFLDRVGHKSHIFIILSSFRVSYTSLLVIQKCLTKYGSWIFHPSVAITISINEEYTFPTLCYKSTPGKSEIDFWEQLITTQEIKYANWSIPKWDKRKSLRTWCFNKQNFSCTHFQKKTLF